MNIDSCVFLCIHTCSKGGLPHPLRHALHDTSPCTGEAKAAALLVRLFVYLFTLSSIRPFSGSTQKASVIRPFTASIPY